MTFFRLKYEKLVFEIMWTPIVSNNSTIDFWYLWFILYQLHPFHFDFYLQFFIELAATVPHTSSLNLDYTILKFFGIVFIEFTTVNNFCLHMIILETNVVMEEDFWNYSNFTNIHGDYLYFLG